MHAPTLPHSAEPAGQGCSTPETMAFDRWLQQRLGCLYADVLREPLPDNLRALLEQPRR